jgi:hypothetical protein
MLPAPLILAFGRGAMIPRGMGWHVFGVLSGTFFAFWGILILAAGAKDRRLGVCASGVVFLALATAAFIWLPRLDVR